MIQKEFSVRIQHNLADYLGMEFYMNTDKQRMAVTTINNQKPRTEVWQESYESHVVNDTWDPKIHCQKTGK